MLRPLKEGLIGKKTFPASTAEIFDKNKKIDQLDLHKKIKQVKSLVFLFYGPPGTGKTMLAEAVSSYLKKKLLVVESPKIIGSWVGETEKNIAKIFQNAKQKDLVICLDEADTLLANRKFSRQDFEIRFVNVMLQEIERFEGAAILTTNMETLLDPALERRVTLKVKFELPDVKLREIIWISHIPKKVTLASDVDFFILAQEFELSGGYIKNVVLNAIRKIASENRKILTMEDLLFGARLEKNGLFAKENKQKVGFTGQV